MRRTISLDGDWERRDFLDEAWRWSDALRGSTDAASGDGPPVAAGMSAGWRPARVPGSAIDDAWRAGEIPNPYIDRNSLAAEWIPERTWLYRHRFRVPDDVAPHVQLRLEGIDPGGIVFLDGVEIGRHSGAFVPFEVDVSGRIRAGADHTIVVAVDAAPWMPSQVSRTELARRPRSRMGYGWDFCPRMIHTGLWRSVSLDTYRCRLGMPRLAVELAADRRSASVGVTVSIHGAGADAIEARILDPEGVVVDRERTTVAGDEVRIGLSANHPRLWWPNGIGEPAMYSLELSLGGEEPLDERRLAFGIRTIEALPTSGADPDALPYTLAVNGRPVWGRGWNWTPIDAAYGVPRHEKLRHLVELLRRANVNLLRVWGGGVIESDELYDACDRAGIMVWQEFTQSSSGVANTPADDARFVELMRRHAEEVVPLRSHHPSLAIWCGGNELADRDGHPLTDAHPVLDALRDVVARLDAHRIWLPTSPSGPRFDNSLDAIADDPTGLHDVHGPWEHQGLAGQHELANAATSLLHSEFGVEGMTNPPTLHATVTDPARRAAGRSDPVIAHRGAWWNNLPFVERTFGAGLPPDELARASQHLQADGLRTLVEGDRRRWPRSAGALPWVFNEPFPNAWSNAAVDYFGVPKAAYHAVAAAYAQILPGLSFGTQALDGAGELTVTPWIVNDSDASFTEPIEVALHDAAGRLLDSHSLSLATAPNAAATGTPLTLAVPNDAADVLILDVTAGPHRARRILSRTATLEPMRHLGRAQLVTAVVADADTWTVHLCATGSVAALEVRLDDARPVGWPERAGAAYLDTNLLTLLPGEEHSIRADWRAVASNERSLRLSGWNVEERILAGG